MRLTFRGGFAWPVEVQPAYHGLAVPCAAVRSQTAQKLRIGPGNPAGEVDLPAAEVGPRDRPSAQQRTVAAGPGQSQLSSSAMYSMSSVPMACQTQAAPVAPVDPVVGGFVTIARAGASKTSKKSSSNSAAPRCTMSVPRTAWPVAAIRASSRRRRRPAPRARGSRAGGRPGRHGKARVASGGSHRNREGPAAASAERSSRGLEQAAGRGRGSAGLPWIGADRRSLSASSVPIRLSCSCLRR